ncbi:sensor histidine kinase [Plantibacter sp. YIM 135249]|uniref:sensor histidine kinase n=1 Tax=Plantibacter sp. YIM 135249 TaxID=3423918 RepID=UPI003D33D7B0
MTSSTSPRGSSAGAPSGGSPSGPPSAVARRAALAGGSSSAGAGAFGAGGSAGPGGSSTATSAGPDRPKRAPWTLRRRLLLVVVGLLALGSVIVGVASAVSMRGLLIEGVDLQLVKAADRAANFGHEGGGTSGLIDPGVANPYGGTREPPAFIGLPGLGPGALGAIVRAGVVVDAGYLDTEGAAVPCSEEQDAVILTVAAGDEPRTVDLGNGTGEYRVVAVSDGLDGTRVVGLPLGGVESTVGQLVGMIACVSILVLIVAGIAAFIIVRISLRPLDRVVATASVVAEMPLDRGEVALAVRVPESDTDPRTEVGRVGAAINRMLGHVSSALNARQASENKVRRFVSDASHELRTPLASISGYSELAARNPDALPDDVTHSLGRIRSEAGRMTTIVEDLLLLARLDEGRELARKPVDLTELAIAAVGDAHVAGPDHVYDIAFPEEPVVVTGDWARLQQVIVNLLANARVHTPAGTTVRTALSVERRDGRDVAVLTVSDDGPGIDERIVPTLFERFVRGDDSRSRATGSTGLGLAIVQAVVVAHHGEVTVDTAPGRTTFRVTLPA